MTSKTIQNTPPISIPHPQLSSITRDLAQQASLIVAIWGNSGAFRNRAYEVVKMFPELRCLRVTGAGQPHHARGLPNGLLPIPYRC
ncbi:DUF1643 domain-containing protein [Methylocaldum szegediense]|uniref:DUF1643 domain-containing protein n=1 Tax=Methylocaldum szegediense TaxID=73780 RepID=UPI0037C98A42